MSLVHSLDAIQSANTWKPQQKGQDVKHQHGCHELTFFVGNAQIAQSVTHTSSHVRDWTWVGPVAAKVHYVFIIIKRTSLVDFRI